MEVQWTLLDILPSSLKAGNAKREEASDKDVFCEFISVSACQCIGQSCAFRCPGFQKQPAIEADEAW